MSNSTVNSTSTTPVVIAVGQLARNFLSSECSEGCVPTCDRSCTLRMGMGKVDEEFVLLRDLLVEEAKKEAKKAMEVFQAQQKKQEEARIQARAEEMAHIWAKNQEKRAKGAACAPKKAKYGVKTEKVFPVKEGGPAITLPTRERGGRTDNKAKEAINPLLVKESPEERTARLAQKQKEQLRTLFRKTLPIRKVEEAVQEEKRVVDPRILEAQKKAERLEKLLARAEREEAAKAARIKRGQEAKEAFLKAEEARKAKEAEDAKALAERQRIFLEGQRVRDMVRTQERKEDLLRAQRELKAKTAREFRAADPAARHEAYVARKITGIAEYTEKLEQKARALGLIA